MTERFSGADYSEERDGDRLSTQLERVRDYMIGHGGWHSIRAIASSTGDPEVSVAAQVRNLRKPRYGAHIVERKRLGGVYVYHLRRRCDDDPAMARPDPVRAMRLQLLRYEEALDDIAANSMEPWTRKRAQRARMGGVPVPEFDGQGELFTGRGGDG